MSQPKLRRALASIALVSALALLPARGLGAEPRQRPERKGREGAARIVTFSPWNLLVELLHKASVRIDPNGHSLNAQTAAAGEEGGARTVPAGGS